MAGAHLRAAVLRAAADRLEDVDVADEVAVPDRAVVQVALLAAVPGDGIDLEGLFLDPEGTSRSVNLMSRDVDG